MKNKTIASITFLILVYLLPHSVTAQVKNPILPGFYPDPSICRVGKDYYLVNSSFSYFPGVPIFHSTDLVNWKQIGHVLDRPSQLKLNNLRISGGIFAPAISYHKGQFYLVTTLSGLNERFNFFVTAKNPAGPWSEPNWLPEVKGIDPSFFFDEDGKAYLVSNGQPPGQVLYKHHKAIWLYEFDIKTRKIISEGGVLVNGGTDITKEPVAIEGPHLYKRNGFYYLLAAEGGTSINHSEVIFRSKKIWGPYEVFSGNPILTQRDLPDNRPTPITCAGHADLVETSDGDWVAVFLGCQPYTENFFNTGRETFILPVDWSGEWPIILKKGLAIPVEFTSPLKLEPGKIRFADYSADWQDDFDQRILKMEWNFIRTPSEKWYKLNNNSLVIQARPVSISEVGNPSFIGRRLQFAKSQFTTALKIEKGKDMEAGVVAFQNEKFFYKFVICREVGKNYLCISSASGEILKTELKDFKEEQEIFLRMKILEADFICEYSLNNQVWNTFGSVMDAKLLSTKVAGGFVGTYVGMYAFAELPAAATFDWVRYQKTF